MSLSLNKSRKVFDFLLLDQRNFLFNDSTKNKTISIYMCETQELDESYFSKRKLSIVLLKNNAYFCSKTVFYHHEINILLLLNRFDFPTQTTVLV